MSEKSEHPAYSSTDGCERIAWRLFAAFEAYHRGVGSDYMLRQMIRDGVDRLPEFYVAVAQLAVKDRQDALKKLFSLKSDAPSAGK